VTEEEFRSQFPQAPPPPGPPPLPIKPQARIDTIKDGFGRPFTVQDVETFLLRFEGNIDLVAAHLTVPRSKLRAYMKLHDELVKWIPVQIAKGVKIVPALKARQELLANHSIAGGPPLTPIPVDPKVDELAKAIADDDKAMKEGLITLGSTEAQATKAVEIGKRVTARMLNNTLGLTTMGVAVNFNNLLEIVGLLKTRIIDHFEGKNPFHCNVKGDPTEMATAFEALASVSEELRRTAELAWKGQLTKARIESIQREDQNSSKRPKSTAGFKPKMAISVSEVS
jgi:hypothetical protein